MVCRLFDTKPVTAPVLIYGSAQVIRFENGDFKQTVIPKPSTQIFLDKFSAAGINAIHVQLSRTVMWIEIGINSSAAFPNTY